MSKVGKSAAEKVAKGAQSMEHVDPVRLKPNPNNAKQHPEKQVRAIAKSIERFGFNAPIVVDEDNVILAGHGRWMAAKSLGMIKVPVVIVRGLTETEKAAFTIAENQLNQMTGYDTEMLAIELQKLDDAGFELSTLGFDEKSIDGYLGFEGAEEVADDLGNADVRLGGVVQLSQVMTLTPDQFVGDFDFPRLREDLLGTFPRTGKHTFWIGGRRTVDDGQSDLIYVYGSDSTKGMDAARTTICFYTDDARFERVWHNRDTEVTRFINAGITQLVMPNFSTYVGMPRAEVIYNMYRSRYLARYFQEAGLMVIPDLEFGDMATLEMSMTGIPVGAPCLMTQIQTVRPEDADHIRAACAVALDRLKPLRLVVYAGEPGLRLGKEICQRAGVEFYGVHNRSAQMRNDVANHAEKGAF